MKFILTDDSVDRDYERVLASGLNLDNFKKNPVMLYQHRQDSFWSDKFAPLPIGYWKDITLEGNKITAEPEFNDTELGQQVKSLVEHGTLNACSIGFRAISYSSDPALMLPGQKYATITQGELLEASIVMIPSNPNAVAIKSFSKDGKKYNVIGESKLTADDESKLDELAKTFFKSQNPTTMTELFKKLSDEVKSDLIGIKALVEKAIKGYKPEEKSAVEATEKEFNDKVSSIEKKLGELQTENESISTAKDAAEASVKTLTTDKETLTNEKAALVTDKETLSKRVTELENSEKELKAANLKLSGETETPETPVVSEKQKNDVVPDKGAETDAQKTARLMKSLEGIDKIV